MNSTTNCSPSLLALLTYFFPLPTSILTSVLTLNLNKLNLPTNSQNNTMWLTDIPVYSPSLPPPQQIVVYLCCTGISGHYFRLFFTLITIRKLLSITHLDKHVISYERWNIFAFSCFCLDFFFNISQVFFFSS